MTPIYPRRLPCPCGSGKKFKNCCEPDMPRIDEARLYAAEARCPGTIAAMADALDQELSRRT